MLEFYGGQNFIPRGQRSVCPIYLKDPEISRDAHKLVQTSCYQKKKKKGILRWKLHSRSIAIKHKESIKKVEQLNFPETGKLHREGRERIKIMVKKPSREPPNTVPNSWKE